MTEQDLKQRYEMYTEAWRFFRKYNNVDNTEEYWEKVATESKQLVKQYNNHKLMIALFSATINELEQICKEVDKK